MADILNATTMVIEPEMLDIIAELDEFKGAWRALSTLAPERLSALRRVATFESIGSSTRTENHVRQLHRDLLRYSTSRPSTPALALCFRRQVRLIRRA